MRAGMAWLLFLCPACFSSIDLSLIDQGQSPDAATPSSDGGPDGGQDPSCPSKMISAPDRSFCIDEVEVGVDDYEKFLADNPRTDQQPAHCAFNTNFEPNTNWPMGQERKRHPVSSITWCDALAYCTAAGRRLCTRDEWIAACSNNGATTYPYGDTYDNQACNGQDSDDTRRVRMPPSCEGGFPGLFDMSGNVAEWIDDCAAHTGQNDSCATIGGSFGGNEASLACMTSGVTAARGAVAPNLGFRCCR